jgi:hypothetical protein
MAHFARVTNGVVNAVTVVDNKDCGGGVFPESEPIGQEFLASLGFDGEWVQCSYNNSFRFWMPSSDYTWDGVAFVMPSPGSGWTLDEETYQWVSVSGSRLPLGR